MRKILVGINNLTEVNQMAYSSHMQFFFNLGKKNPDDNFILCNPRRMSIDRMRNFCAKVVLDLGLDYLMFVDDDVLLPKDAYNQLVTHLEENRADIVAGVTLIRGYPYHPMIFDFANPKSHYMDDYAAKADEHGLVKCDAVGFSCCLIRGDVLRKMTPPYFITGEKHTEDVYFCQKAVRQVPGTKVAALSTLETMHILGTEVIGPFNKAQRKAFDEAMDTSLFEETAKREAPLPTETEGGLVGDPTVRQDRGKKYFEALGIDID